MALFIIFIMIISIGSDAGVVFADGGDAPDAEYADADWLDEDFEGKTVVLSTNDVHGAVGRYRYVAGLKRELTGRGADVILVDSGDFLQGEIYVNSSKGESAIKMMNLAGYDYSTLGNHEFDFGQTVKHWRLLPSVLLPLSEDFHRYRE